LLAGVGINVDAIPRFEERARTAHSAFRCLLEHLSRAEILRVIERLERDESIPERDVRRFRVVSWPMLKDLQKAGMTVGSHTRTHALLTNESEHDVFGELSESRRLLEARLQSPVGYFAYPDGRFNRAVVRNLPAAGYRAGFGICPHQDTDFPRMTIPRRSLWERSFVDVSGRFAPALMSCAVSGLFDRRISCVHAQRLAS
jgi:peptidoglycan/xylan/chitin deacetylase (PgdA/CDA1 family)